MRCGRNTEEKLPQPSTTAIPANPSVKTGNTKLQACDRNAPISTSSSSSTIPSAATDRFLPKRMRRGSTGNRKSVVRLCLSRPRVLYESINIEKKTARGAVNVSTPQLLLDPRELKRGPIINTPIQMTD